MAQPVVLSARTPSKTSIPGATLALLASLAALGALSTNVMLPSFPTMARDLGVEVRALGLLLSSFFVAFAVGQLVVGPVSDRIGRKPMVLGGLAVFALGCVVCALANSLELMIVGRVIQALGVCAASVLSRAIARDLFEGDVLSKALALTMIAMAAAPGFSPLLGTALDAVVGWRATFLVVGLMGAMTGAAYVVRLGETHPGDRRTSPSPLAIAAAYGALATDRAFIAPALAVSLLIGGLYALFGAAPAILLGGMGMAPTQLGLFFAATFFVVFGAGMLAPRLAQRLGARTVVGIGATTALAGGGVLAAMPTPGFVPFAAAIVVFLFGMGLANPIGSAMSLQPFGRQAGLASALLGFLQMGVAAIATALSTALPLAPAPSLGLILAGGAGVALLSLTAHRQYAKDTPA